VESTAWGGLTNRYRGAVEVDGATARPRAGRQTPPAAERDDASCRRLAAHLGVDKNIVQRVRREADARPHRLARYMASNDPDFETKVADSVDLYLHAPRHAAVFRIDEKTASQALDRRDRVLPLAGPGRGHGFEYKRHGTLSVYAALNVRTRFRARPQHGTRACTS